jgi:hypothetical protein
MRETDWTEVVGAIGLFTLIISVVTLTIWQVAVSWRAKAALSREDEYRQLAEAAVRTQQNTERLLAEALERLSHMQTRLDSFERILTEVE